MATRAVEGIKVVRAQLCDRLDRLEARVAARGPVGGADEAAAIAAIASDHGMKPVQRLAEGLAVALGSGGRGAAIGPWIEQLREAIACELVDEASGSTWLAAVMSRLAG